MVNVFFKAIRKFMAFSDSRVYDGETTVNIIWFLKTTADNTEIMWSDSSFTRNIVDIFPEKRSLNEF